MRFLVLSLLSACSLLQAATSGFYQQPALHGDVLLFVAEGDVWRVSTSGGTAHRLTTHSGWENRPAISPDGKTLAFAAILEGKAELYSMPLAGGVPVRMACSSAGNPKASKPIGCITQVPRIRSKRLTMSVAV